MVGDDYLRLTFNDMLSGEPKEDTEKTEDKIPFPFRTFFVVRYSSFRVDVCHRKNDFRDFHVVYSASEILRLGR